VTAPHSLEAEQATLGSILLDPSACRDVAMALRADDFYRPDHRLIAKAIACIARESLPDLALVVEQLAQAGELEEAGGASYLRTLVRDTSTAANVAIYAQNVRAYATRRRLLQYMADPGKPEELQATLEQELARIREGGATREDLAKPLDIEPASAWAGRPEPAPRDWVIDGLVPAVRVTSLLGNGGLGKTLLAVQIAVHVALGRHVFGQSVSGGPVLGIFCEDEQEELERRARAACGGEDIELESLERLYMLSRDGMDNLLCTFDREQIVMTPFYRELDATIAALKPRLTILDTAADLFGGDFMSTPQVRQFLKVALGGLCVRHETAILLLAHPSASAMNSGDGGGFSTAWNNSVRSRLYLRRPKTEDTDEAKDRRVLEVRKSNYAADGTAVSLRYEHGYFVPDLDPVDEDAKPIRASKADTRLAVAALEQLRKAAPVGVAVSLSAILKPLQDVGALPKGDTAASAEKARKALQRTLNQLAADNLIIKTTVPRGYRLPPQNSQETAS
jgi:RecA-family ATPase